MANRSSETTNRANMATRELQSTLKAVYGVPTPKLARMSIPGMGLPKVKALCEAHLALGRAVLELIRLTDGTD